MGHFLWLSGVCEFLASPNPNYKVLLTFPGPTPMSIKSISLLVYWPELGRISSSYPIRGRKVG